MIIPYLGVLIIVGLVGFMGVMSFFASFIMRPRNPYAEKLTPWECGMEPVGEANAGHFRVHYFIIAILFIVFDVETLFLFPWATLLTDKGLSGFIFIEMIVFVAILAIGFIYAWVKGALEWV
ncbi:MAG: NADH-quinone oxidoreductase subunit A [Deltaproteobacteria bacterium]|nr:NADH-quinone oxidoreductase subunit A [Deltaproteobacteria bacterium]